MSNTKFVDVEKLIQHIKDNLEAIPSSAISDESIFYTFRVIDQIRAFPTSDVKEVKHGHWEKVKYNPLASTCSVCGEQSCCKSPYCEECGAIMDEENDND